ncbi:general secretory pathway protein [Hyphomonas polymorpha PS728]|uniref:General secretory pathway protein n=1 Tax=Hyphomonas polymorpha PS728 TaxID=1280954 RepID=A0A062VLT6_9PROT|nr:type II secretion system protein GspK [Hyphomonas polymorpha]KDA00622.1 general secretory pathway protein [Hyphomonas polymorpha PS728]
MPVDSEKGFILPGVLAFIAATMSIILIGAAALDQARDVSVALQSDRKLLRALDNMEARATYLFLTSPPVRYGVSLSGGARDATEVILGTPAPSRVEVEAAAAEDLWRADGGRIALLSPGVRGTAEYHDLAGLVSLNSSDPALIAALLERFGISTEDALTMTARLRDFTDEDNIRRTRGAERQEYRLRGLPPPPNSPLRRVAEASGIYGWEGFAPLGSADFLSLVTAASTVQDPVWSFSPPAVLELRAALPVVARRNEDVLATVSSTSLVPGAHGRLTLRAYDEETGRSRLRIVEISRTVGAAAAPWSRSLVLDRPEPAGTPPPETSGLPSPAVFRRSADE